MKVGEIKAQAIMLMYPSVFVKYDETDDADIERAIYELKLDPNFEGLINSFTGSINRALAYIESQGYGERKCVHIKKSECERTADGLVILKTEKDFYKAESVLCRQGDKAAALDFEVISKGVITKDMGTEYTLIYRARMPRLSTISCDSAVLEVPLGMAEHIPYFLASELLANENEELSREYRGYFEREIKHLGELGAECHSCVMALYSME